MQRTTMQSGALLSAGLLLTQIGVSANAQEQQTATEQDDAIEEITITAQRRVQSLQEVPLAVTAFNAELLQEAGFQDVEDLAVQVPNLQISALFGTSNPKIFLRGVGNNNFNQTAQSKVGVYVDQVYLSAASGQLFQMFDLERVEVLRGPQGTLYGKNTTGGAISISSRQPGDEISGRATLGVGNYDALTFEGAIDLPISETLNSRFAVVSRDRDGYLRDAGNNIDVNDTDLYAWRATFDYMPRDGQQYIVNLHGGSSDSTHNNSEHRGLFDPALLAQGQFVRLSPERVVAREGVDILGYQDPDPDPYLNTYGTETFALVDLFGASLTANIEFENALTLTSITAYEESDRHVLQEGNGAPSTIFTIDWGPSEFSQFSQEIRFSSPAENRLNWILGLFYFQEDGEVNNFYDLTDLTFALGFSAIDQFYDQETEGYAGFGQLVYGINDELTLTLGGRYSFEERELVHDTFITDVTRVPFAPLVDVDLQEDWSEWSGQLALDYQPSNTLTLYGSVARGFTAGGFNTGAFNDPIGALRIFDPEFLVSYELGVKSLWLDRKLRVNAATFYYDYEDLQVFTFNEAGLQFIENASDASIYGLELEITARPIAALEVTASLGLTESEYENFITGQGDLSGNQLIGSPNVQANLLTQYTQTLSQGELVYRANITYTGERFYDENQRPDLSSEGNDTIVDIRLSYVSPQSRYEISAWARNLFEQAVVIDAVDVGAFGYQNVWYNTPRTFGLDFSYNF